MRPPLDRRELVRKELARLEAEIALCDRCYGHEPRLPARFERPGLPPRVLIIGERPPRAVLSAQGRIGPSCRDGGTRFLTTMLREAGIPVEETVCGAAALCRPASRALEKVVPPSVWSRECASFVAQLVRLTEPRLLVPLGHRALRALKIAFPQEDSIRQLRFPAMIGRTVQVGSVLVHPLYHTTVRARVTRPEREQRRDWRRVGRVWEWLASGERGPLPRSLARPP